MNFDELIEERKKYRLGPNDELIECIIKGSYPKKFAIVPAGALYFKNKKIIENIFFDVITTIPSPFTNTNIEFSLIHIVDKKPDMILTGIYHGVVCYKNKEINHRNWKYELTGEYTEDFKNFVKNIELFISNKEIKRDDLNIILYDTFEKQHINPLYYTKQAIDVRKELNEHNSIKLCDLADIITNQTDKNIIGKVITSKDFNYPFGRDKIANQMITRATKVKNGDIIGLLIGDKPKFYLYTEEYNDIYIKPGNYCIIRCKEKKYNAYLASYLNDEKALMYFSTVMTGTCIKKTLLSDLKETKVLIPSEKILKIANLSIEYASTHKENTIAEINDLLRNNSNDKYKFKTEEMVTNDLLNNITKIKIKALKEVIDGDMVEVNRCFNIKAYKAAIILCGSILEAVLLDWLSEYENINDAFDVGVKADGKDLELYCIINKLESIIKPKWYEAKMANEIRKTRNMVHPKVCLRNNKNITQEECKKIIQELNDIIQSKENRYK